MSTYVDKPLSLIERKKLQWAKEKEELAGLSAPWGTNKDPQAYDRSFQRSRYVPKLAMANNEFFRKDFTISRRSSLPPLSKNQYNSVDREMGGETSGYGSDNPNHTIEQPSNNNWNQSGYESSSSFKDDRPKWKDKTKFWDVNENDPPNWVKRGLQRDEEIVVSNTSPAESPQQDEDAERPYTSSSGYNRTFIRGQNIRVDSSELAERERRRQIALAHQEAIRQQLEEREKRRQEEKQQRIKEEQEEELRIEREQEIERRRKENELRMVREKQERERKRKEALQEALEVAEKEAKLEKIKQKMKKQNNLAEEETVTHNVVIHNDLEAKKEKEESEAKRNNNNVEQTNFIVVSPKPEVLNNEANNMNFEVTGKSLPTPRNNERSLTPRNNERSETPRNVRSSHSFQLLTTPRSEMALVLQTPYEVLQNMQYAVLMPNLNGNNGIPIAIPLAVSPEKTTTYSPRTENRILTPTQYRNRNKTLCDSSTQTEDMELNNRPETDTCSNNHKYIREKLTNLELNYDNRSRKERRSRSDDRSVGEKPKWGANRPPTRYMKQSEKDPFYQRRKLRQKNREYKNSSDESQTGSPRTYRKKNYVEKRQTRALWRKNDHYFARNIRMYQTEIVPLESDKEQIYYPVPHKCECCCRCRCETKTEILKIEHTSPRLPDCNENVENATYIIDKLTSLHNGLVLKQEQWERSPRTPSLSSSTRNTENN